MANETTVKQLPMVVNQGGTTVMARLSDKYSISAPLVLAFAEYLGYLTPLMPWVDKWCLTLQKPSPAMVMAINIDASNALREVTKAFSARELREMYDDLYDLVLNVYDANISGSKDIKI